MKLYPLQTSSESEDFEQDTGTEDFFDNLFHNIYQESLNLLKHNIIKRDLQKWNCNIVIIQTIET